jgi:serine/threonine protein kinase
VARVHFDDNETGNPHDSSGEEPTAAKKPESQIVTRTIDFGESVAGAVFGPYRLLEMIGEGGMGEVWLAEQKQPVRRRVALKLIKAGTPVKSSRASSPSGKPSR